MTTSGAVYLADQAGCHCPSDYRSRDRISCPNSGRAATLGSAAPSVLPEGNFATFNELADVECPVALTGERAGAPEGRVAAGTARDDPAPLEP